MLGFGKRQRLLFVLIISMVCCAQGCNFGQGGDDSSEGSAGVNNHAPTADFSAPDIYGVAVALDASDSSDSDGDAAR